MKKNWKRRIKEFWKLFTYNDPEMESEDYTLRYWWKSFLYSFDWCLIHGRTELASTKSWYTVIEPEDFWKLDCDLEVPE